MEENRMHQMFGAFSMGSDAMRKNSRAFWEGQTGLLDQMQAFMNGWFERRQAGTRAALEACERMCSASTPSEWLGEYQKWLTGAFERISADGLACQHELRNVSEGLGASLVPSTEEKDGIAQEKTKKHAAAGAR